MTLVVSLAWTVMPPPAVRLAPEPTAARTCAVLPSDTLVLVPLPAKVSLLTWVAAPVWLAPSPDTPVPTPISEKLPATP